jgi:hypothetical protein
VANWRRQVKGPGALGAVVKENSMLKQEQEKPALLFNLGDRVKIRLSGGLRGRIVEWRGPLGPGGAQIYRVLIRRKPEPTYIELRQDQLELAPTKS